MNSRYLKVVVVMGVGMVMVVGIVLLTNQAKKAEVMTEVPTPRQADVTVTPTPKPDANVNGGLFITLESPMDKAAVATSAVVVKGKSVIGAKVVVNKKEMKVDNQGEFSVTVDLEKGNNIIKVMVSDNYGNKVEKEISIFREI